MPEIVEALTAIDRDSTLLARQWDTPLAAHLAYLALNLKCQAERTQADELARGAQGFARFLHDAVRQAREQGEVPAAFVPALWARLATLHELGRPVPPPAPVAASDRVVLWLPPELDASRLLRELGRAGVHPLRVGSSAELVSLLDTRPPAVLAVLRLDAGIDGALTALMQTRLADVPLLLLAPELDYATRLNAVRLGARAFLPWPLAGDELADALARLAPRLDPAPLRALVVEAAPELADWYAGTLAQHGMDTRVADSGSTGFEALIRFSPDVLVVDQRLPEGPGLEFVHVVRQARVDDPVPVVMLAADARHPVRPNPEAPVAAWLDKPVQAEALAAAALNAARLHRVRRARAATDPLTGVLAERALADRLDAELACAARQHQPLTLAVLDIVGLGDINRQQGYAVGDRVLLALARLLRERLRRHDVVGRMAGDRFVLVLPDAGAETADALLASLALAFAARQSEDGLRTTAARFTAAVCRAEPGDTAAVWLPRLRDWPLPAVDGPADGAGQSAS